MSERPVLGNKIECSVFDLLKYIRLTVRMVNINKALFLVDQCFITVDAKVFPCINKVRNGIAMRTSTEIIIARIKPSANVHSGYPFPGL